jgi:hypothetical protein
VRAGVFGPQLVDRLPAARALRRLRCPGERSSAADLLEVSLSQSSVAVGLGPRISIAAMSRAMPSMWPIIAS